MCSNCTRGISGVRDGEAVACRDCGEGLQRAIAEMRDQVAKYDVTLARYDGSETGWQAAYRDRLYAARAACVRRARDLQEPIGHLEADPWVAQTLA